VDRHCIPEEKVGSVSTEHFAPPLAEPIAVCGVRFTHASYDEVGDDLYLTRGVPLRPADGDTREGHAVFLGGDDRVICVIINGARWLLDRDGAIEVTLRDGGPTTRLERDVIEPLLVDTPVSGRLDGWD
jgi:hypothetical protein